MLKRIILLFVAIFAFATMSLAQETDTPITTKVPPPPKTRTTQPGTTTKTSASMSMLDTFNALLEGIRSANAKVVSDFYWRSPELVIFNSNGTVTRGWDQMSKNRESSYAKLKDVILQESDVHARMFGLDYGEVNFLWTQSQTNDGVPDSASGRTTLIFRRVGKAWKIIHAHISPSAPDQSRVLQSEQEGKGSTEPRPR